MVDISAQLRISDTELEFRTSRSSGPGGQNVNKVETRVTLLFDLDASPSLEDDQKARIRERLSGRISREGVLRVSSQRHRTQGANRQATVERFAELLAEALREQAPRKEKRRSKASKRRRLEAKRRRSATKTLRGKPQRWDD